MLTDLLIKNYALIEQLKMKPHGALNIITGETGAGKSIMLGAIGLLLGNRADTKVLYNEEDKCVVEASFLIWSYNLKKIFEENDIDYEDHTTIRREIVPGGKSRAFINDSPVTLDMLKKIGSYLIEIHSQNDNLLLSDHLFQLQVVDIFAGNGELVKKYGEVFKNYQSLKKAYEQMQAENAQSLKEFEYNNFLLQELNKANLTEGEQEQLESEEQLLERAEEVKTRLNTVAEYLSRSENCVNDLLKSVVQQLNPVAGLSKEIESLRERAESCLIELQDIAKEVEREEEMVEHNPERITEVQGRLSLLYNLQQKHQVKSVTELLEIQQNLTEKVNKVLNFDEQLSVLKMQLDEAEIEVNAQAAQLSEIRRQFAAQIEEEIIKLIVDLGMPNGVVKISFEKTEPMAFGFDLVNFLFSANKGIAPQEISKVASGGEFSRLMFAIKFILAGKTALPTIIFDEIDTGISGEVALKMGKMLKMMSTKHQVMAITHLHQIAAKGNHHYFVYKDDSSDRSVSRIRQLLDEERIQVIAEMISGAQPTESALTSARELLEL